MTTIFVVIDIGCYECGVGHEVIGAYTTEAEAESVALKRDKDTDGWRDGGSTSASVFRIDLPQEVG